MANIPTMKTFTAFGETFEVVDEVARASVEQLREDVDDIIADSLVDFKGASASAAGIHGMVPAPKAGDQGKCLMGDGTWKEVADKTLESTVSSLSTNMTNHTNNKSNPHGVTYSQVGAAAASHGTHVTYSTDAPKVASGTGSAGSAGTVARSDHAHPVQTSVSGNAGSASKVNNSMIVKLNGGSTEGTNMFTFDGSTAKNVNITPSSIGAAATHSHPYASSSHTHTPDEVRIFSGTELPEASGYQKGDIYFLHS